MEPGFKRAFYFISDLSISMRFSEIHFIEINIMYRGIVLYLYSTIWPIEPNQLWRL